MNSQVLKQILAIRASGETNMFDVPRVREIAQREGYFELFNYLITNTSGYSRFILTGDSGDEAQD